jgi:hypothetical protein
VLWLFGFGVAQDAMMALARGAASEKPRDFLDPTINLLPSAQQVGDGGVQLGPFLS